MGFFSLGLVRPVDMRGAAVTLLMRRRQNILFQGQREGLVLSAVCNHLVYRVAGWGGLGTAYLDAVGERWNCVESQKGTVF